MRFTAILLLFSAFLSPGQSLHRNRTNPVKRHSSTPSSAGSATEYLNLVSRLRAEGAKVKLTAEQVRQPFFSVPGRIITINDESLQVFRFANASAAKGQAKRVAPDGMTIGTSKPSWMAPPHFFKSGELIVLYVGANESILKVLQVSLGAQFAGG